MGKLSGKIAIVTGGNSGIGLATAKLFAGENASVIITGRRQAELDAAVAEIGGNALGIQGDVANLADLDRLYAEVQRQFGHIDILFANAGISELAPIGSVTEEHFDKVFGINVKGLCLRYKRRCRCWWMAAQSSSIRPLPIPWALKVLACILQPRPQCVLSPEPGRWN